jgi:hypothetical protein
MLDVAIVCTASGLSSGTVGTAALVYDRADAKLRVTQTSAFVNMSRDAATMRAIVNALHWYLHLNPEPFRSFLVISDNPSLVSQGGYGGENTEEWNAYRSAVCERHVLWKWESRLDHQQLVAQADDARCAAITAERASRHQVVAGVAV